MIRENEAFGRNNPLAETLRLLTHPLLISAREAIRNQQLPFAEASLDQLLVQTGEVPFLLNLRGEIEARRGRFRAAAGWFHRSLANAPDYPAALYGLAVADFNMGNLAAALRSVNRMLITDPVNMSARLLKAAVHAHAGDHELSALVYQGILAENPGHVASMLGLGHSLRIGGRTSDAIATYKRAIERDPTSGETWAHLSNLKTYVFSDAELSAMLDLDHRKNLPTEQQVYLNYALGKVFYDRCDNEQAFDRYTKANRLARSMVREDPELVFNETAHWVERSIAAFASCISKTIVPLGPIFIVGMPRSGSTLVEQIIGTHSKIESTTELSYLATIGQRLKNPAIDLATIDCQALAREYLDHAQIHRKTQKPVFIDKMPYNYRHVALIHAMFPAAKIIDVRRYPLATCVAVFRQNFLGMPELSGTPVQIAAAWSSYARTMRRFDTALPGAVHLLRYEDLVNDVGREVRRLFDFIGLPFEDACLRWFENGQAVRTPSSEQVRQPIFRSGLDSWRRFDTKLADARRVLGDEVSAYLA